MTTKRIFDICSAIVGLLVLSPILLAAGIAVKLGSPGPVLFTDVRIGRRGRRFVLYRFRSIVPHRGGLSAPRVGQFIRLCRIDLLPQLINVVKGDMSFVGPRPQAPSVVERYTPEERAILEVRPGITGPAHSAGLEDGATFLFDQVTKPGLGLTQRQKLDLELQYVRKRTLGGDIRILLTTTIQLARSVFAHPQLGRTLKFVRLTTDLALITVATYAAFVARFDGHISARDAQTFFLGLPFELVAYACGFLYLTTYRSIWRYTGVADFWQVVKACTIGGSLNAAGMHIIGWPYPRSVLVLTPVFAVLLMAAVRLTWRTVATAFTAGESLAVRRRVVIVGAGRVGASVAREILGTPGLGYDVVGFVDNDRRLERAMLHNVSVLGTIDQLPELSVKYALTEAIIAIPRPTLNELRRIREACGKANLVFRTLPSLDQLVSGDGQIRYLRKVDVGELLQREPLSLKIEAIAGFLQGKRVMVTGAGGSIGSELCRQIVRLGADSLVMVERAENALFAMCSELQGSGSRTKLTAALADTKHVSRMSDLFEHFRPQVVFHTAAYKHVPMLEEHPTEAVLNNVISTVRLANLATAHAVESFIFISTDKAVRPNNLMGATKRICELYLTALNDGRNADALRTQFRIVRFGNVLGSAGSALPLFQRQIESGAPITITDPDVSRFFMSIEEAVGLVLESATLDTLGGIAVLDMGEPIKITTLADDFITALGLTPSEVPRQFIGLRPGEKLHEVLWEEVDEVVQSIHPRIAVVRLRARPLKEMDAFVRQLEQLAIEGLVDPLLAKVRELVPSYPGSVGHRPPWVMQVDAEPRKASLPLNGASTTSSKSTRAERSA